MKSKRKSIIFPLCVFSLVFPLVACTGPSTVPNSKIVLNEKSIVLDEEEQFQIEIQSKIVGEVEYVPFDEEIVSVDENGLVKALMVGKTQIVVRNNGKSAVLNVEVIPPKNGKVINEINRKLVWNDEFNADKIDKNVWGFQLGVHDNFKEDTGVNYWGNNEKQCYTEENSHVENGSLYITAKRENKTTDLKNGDEVEMEYTSSRMLTRGKKSFLYGYFETKMKTPTIQGMWPAFWMMPEPQVDGNRTSNEYGGWPVSGEIDIFEARGSQPSRVDMTIHFGNPYKYDNSYINFEDSTCAEWHRYGIDRRSDYMAWYIDGVKCKEVSKDVWYSSGDSENELAPFDKPFYFIYNLAVGGNFDSNKMPPDDFEQASMIIDYLRVYE